MKPLPANTILRSPAAARRMYDGQEMRRSLRREERALVVEKKNRIEARLALADDVKRALEALTEQLFGNIVEQIERHLTVALQEVLEQPLALKVTRGSYAGRMTLAFHVERDGNPEDILRGQGGSVANVLSVGLRLLALTTLPAARHRRVLVLDEQDCWLRPDLVPKLVKIVHAAGKALKFQVMMISHHDVSAFEQYADRIYYCTPSPDGLKVELAAKPRQSDKSDAE